MRTVEARLEAEHSVEIHPSGMNHVLIKASIEISSLVDVIYNNDLLENVLDCHQISEVIDWLQCRGYLVNKDV